MTGTGGSELTSFSAGGLVVRSPVPAGLPYNDYRKYLRPDFIYSCAYCTITEAEAQGMRFTIDHYEPQGTSGVNVDAYENLMYACDECNIRKGNRSPPENARAAGIRFFRPDTDLFEQHFEFRGVRLEHKSEIGFYTREALDLNRQTLKRIREYRARLVACHEEVAEGLKGLARLHIDQLPREVRQRALNAIKKAQNAGDSLAAEIDELLRENARSAILDEDPEARDRAKGRKANLKGLEALHPGEWRRRRRQ